MITLKKPRLLIDASGMVVANYTHDYYTLEYKMWGGLDLYIHTDEFSIYLVKREFGKDLFWFASELPWRDNKWVITASNVTNLLKSGMELTYVESIPALIRESLVPTKSIGDSGLRIFAPKNECGHIVQFLRDKDMIGEPKESRVVFNGN